MDIERDPKLERESGGTEQIYFDVRKGHKAFATYIFSVNNVLNFARMWTMLLVLLTRAMGTGGTGQCLLSQSYLPAAGRGAIRR